VKKREVNDHKKAVDKAANSPTKGMGEYNREPNRKKEIPASNRPSVRGRLQGVLKKSCFID
jgi:hypothetical protein